MKFTVMGVSAVVDLRFPRVEWIGRDMHESQERMRAVHRRYDNDPLAAVQCRGVVDVDVSDITRPTDDRWAPAVNEIVICGVPPGHELWEWMVVVVRRHLGDRWSVRCRASQIDCNGRPAVIPRDSDWTTYLMSIDQAMQVADRYARTVTSGGRTADQIMAAERRK